MRMSTTRATALVFLRSLSVCLAAPGQLGGRGACPRSVRLAGTLVRVLALVESTYVDEIPGRSWWARPSAGSCTISIHSKWLSPDAYNKLQLRTEGGQGELGVEPEMSEDGATVKGSCPAVRPIAMGFSRAASSSRWMDAPRGRITG